MIFITGATGFVGRGLCAFLSGRIPFRIAVRDMAASTWPADAEVVQACLSSDQEWSDVLAGVSVIIHCAGRAHVMNDEAADPLAVFRRVNFEGTMHLARQAAQAGVQRFVFLSSIKANGDITLPGKPFTADQTSYPADSHALSKCEAEEGLRALSQETGMEVVIIRPPLVYGPGAKANVLAMMRWLRRGIPLPLGSVTENRRSLVFLDNLVSLIVTCVDHPAAANQRFLVSDGEDLSTVDLLRRMGAALGRPARLVPVPVGLLSHSAQLIGRPGIAQRLCGSLQVDIGKTKSLLGWSPPISVDEGLRRTAEHWLRAERKCDAT